jgi:hypothetical protein
VGIDAKTLRRWLAEAQLPLHSHPRDGRKKAISDEHLQTLARLHQRRLAPLPQEPPALLAGEEPELSAALLALPEMVCSLQSQVAALQQQVTDLTRLLTQHQQEPAIPAAPAKPGRRSKPSPKLAPPAPRSRLAATAFAKTPRKPVHVIPRVEYGKQGHYVVICPEHGVLPFEPDTPEWFAWLAEQSSFRFVGKLGHFSAHHEWCVKKGAWRAHRQFRNHGYHLRLAPTQELTMAVLEQAAEALQAHLM